MSRSRHPGVEISSVGGHVNTRQADAGDERAQSVLLAAVLLVFLAAALDLFSLGGSGLTFHPLRLGDLLGGRSVPRLLEADFMVLAGTGALLVLALPRLAPVPASLLTLASMAPPIALAWWRPWPLPLVPMEYTLLTILVLFAVKVLASYFSETRQRQQLVAAFGQYVPPALVAEINRNPQAFTMSGQARELTVLFCDIQRFSQLAEDLPPAALAEMLNLHLSAMTSVLHRHGATIDKYIGDAIMAFWGAPLPQEDHARRAVAAALDMQREMVAVRTACARRGWPAIAIGIGIHSGMVSVGNMGSRFRVAYTVLGDAVNLAARLEALTRYYGADILIGDATRAACADLTCRELDHVRVKGKGRATRIYQPVPAAAWDGAREARHQAALNAYYGGAWDEARRQFATLAEDPAAAPYYRVMLARMQADHPPGWDGVVRFAGEFSYSFASGDGAD